MALWRRVACATSLEENAQEEPVFAPPEHVQEEIFLKRHPKQENFETWNCSLSRGLQLQFMSGSRRARSARIPGNGSSCTSSLSGWHFLSTCSNMNELQNFNPSSSHSSHSSHSLLNLHTWLLGSHSQLATEACAGRCGLSGQRLHRWSVAQALWALDRISCHVGARCGAWRWTSKKDSPYCSIPNILLFVPLCMTPWSVLCRAFVWCTLNAMSIHNTVILSCLQQAPHSQYCSRQSHAWGIRFDRFPYVLHNH